MIVFRNPNCYLTMLLDFFQNMNVPHSHFGKRKFLGAWLNVFETMKHWQFDILIGSYAKILVTQLKQDLVPRYWVCYLVK